MGTSVTIGRATAQDAEQILKLQYLCFQKEAELAGDYAIAPLTQTLDALRGEVAGGAVLVGRLGREVVGSVRGTVDEDGIACLSRLIVHPRMQRHGLGGRLLSSLEELLTAERAAARYRLTAHVGEGGLRLYQRLGYTAVATKRFSAHLSLVTLDKPAPAPALAAGA